MQKNKISKEERSAIIISIIKYNRFTYNHVTYDSFAACCMAYEIKPICVRRYAKRKHFLLRHALSSYLNYHNKKKKYISADRNILHLHHVAEHLDAMHLMCRHTQNGTEYPEKKL